MKPRNKDVLNNYAMHIFKNLDFKPMNALTLEQQLTIKETLLMVYRDAAETESEKEDRSRILDVWRSANNFRMGERYDFN